MTFDAFDAMTEPEFLWWAVKVMLALAAFCAMVMAARWVVRKAKTVRREQRRHRRRMHRFYEAQLEWEYRHGGETTMTQTWKIACDAPGCANTLLTSETLPHPMLYCPNTPYLLLVLRDGSTRHFCSFDCLAAYVKEQRGG